jgi:hypothetical protein
MKWAKAYVIRGENKKILRKSVRIKSSRKRRMISERTLDAVRRVDY